MRLWSRYAGVFRLHVWGGCIDDVWDHVSKDSAYGYVHVLPGTPVVGDLIQLDEVYCFPAKTRTLSKPDLPLKCLSELLTMNYTHARRIDAWTNEHRARGGR
jgi:hypothetical protein